MKPDQRPNRDPPRFTPSEEWIKAFENGYTQLMIMNVTSYARVRARHVGSVSSSYPEDLVQNAASDTVQGILTWDPKQKSLEQHLRDAVKVRTHHDRKRARKFPHYPLDPATTEGQATMVEADEALLAQAPDSASAQAAAADALDLFELAKDDRDVLRIINARIHGAATKREVMSDAGLSSAAYHNARRRLSSYLTQLSRARRSSERVA